MPVKKLKNKVIPMSVHKKFNPFGLTVSLAIGNLLTNVLFYYIDIYNIHILYLLYRYI